MSSSSTPPRCVLTGQKLKKKVYYHHTGYIGGIKERTAGAIMARQVPRADRREGGGAHAAARPAGPRQLANLRVYAGAEHPHEAQQPEKLDVGEMNPKNTNFHQVKAA